MGFVHHKVWCHRKSCVGECSGTRCSNCETLEQERDALRAEVERLHEKYDFQLLVKERDSFRAALEFYANEDNYRRQSKSGHVEDWSIPIMEDEGDIAQKALGKQ